MITDKYLKNIELLTSEIEKNGNIWDLYYQRGYYYFLSDDNDNAKADYIKAVSYGLDFTKYPYYSFSNSNEKRREFLLPEKILVVLILIIIFISIFNQIASFITKYFNN